MKLNSHSPHKKARIEIIPLIDIMFFLLASFMLVSMSMIKLQAIETKLPSIKGPSSPQTKPDFIAIGIDNKGFIYYDKDKSPVEADTIHTRLAPVYKEKKDDTKVFINCDGEASYDKLVSVLDEVRQVGIAKVSFAVKKGNKFDPDKPRPTTHPEPGAPAVGAPAAPAAPAPPAPPTNP